MAKLTKRVVDAATVREKDYFIWDDELPGFGLRIFASGKRSYLIQYRAADRAHIGTAAPALGDYIFVDNHAARLGADIGGQELPDDGFDLSVQRAILGTVKLPAADGIHAGWRTGPPRAIFRRSRMMLPVG